MYVPSAQLHTNTLISAFLYGCSKSQRNNAKGQTEAAVHNTTAQIEMC